VNIKRTVVGIVLNTLALSACSTTPAGDTRPTGTVTGKVTYLQRMALPSNALVEVALLDVTRQDAPPMLIAAQTLPTPGQVPIAFKVNYDPAVIDPDRTYAIQARILAGGKLLLSNPAVYPVITRGNPSNVDVVVQPVPASQGTGQTTPRK
jgi:putative lipoprotein